MEDDDVLELVSEQKSMSRSLEDYGSQKSTAITVATSYILHLSITTYYLLLTT